MAAALLFNAEFRAHHLRRERHMSVRRLLRDVSDKEIEEYRLPRQEIHRLVEDYERSRFANDTERGHAIPAETQVSKLREKKD